VRGARLRAPLPRIEMPAISQPVGWPRNWEKLCAQLARFFHWPPDAVWGLSGTDMMFWCARANEMISREAEGRRNGR
jgi:hypothetical protein